MSSIFKIILLAGVFSISILGSAQTRTANTDGTWTTASNWSGSNVADVLAEDAVLNYDVDLTHSATTLTVGGIDMRDRSTLALSASGAINIGNSSTTGNLTASRDNRIDIGSGTTITVWGDVDILDRVDLVITGDLIVKGDLNIDFDGQVTVAGNLTVDGDMGVRDRISMNVTGTTMVKGNLTGGYDNSFTVNGSFEVLGDATFLDRSNAGGSGSVGVGGTCSNGSGSSFCTFASTILPIDLLSFSAKALEEGVLVQWATATEENNSHFEIQRSYDGRNYETFTTIAGAGNSSQILNYDLVDGLNYTGLVYYRLVQVDYDGRSETFRPVSVKLETSNTQAEFFFDEGSGLSLIHNLGEIKNVHVEIFDMAGRRRISTQQLISSSQIAIDDSTLKSGIYIIRAQINQLPFVQKVLLRRD